MIRMLTCTATDTTERSESKLRIVRSKVIVTLISSPEGECQISAARLPALIGVLLRRKPLLPTGEIGSASRASARIRASAGGGWMSKKSSFIEPDGALAHTTNLITWWVKAHAAFLV
jgi:hypothetical protein